MSNGEPGPGVDAQGRVVVDPTANVLQVVAAAVKRQDDLREVEAAHVREIIGLHAAHAQELREAEAQRIDAIRAVDVAAVQRAAEVQTLAASTLATVVSTSAEAMRSQVAATATAADVSLKAALEPVQRDIADLRRAQYEGVGQKAQVGETRQSLGAWIAAAGFLLAVGLAVFGMAVGS